MNWHVNIARDDEGYLVKWNAGAQQFKLNKTFEDQAGATKYADALKDVLKDSNDPADRDAVVRALRAEGLAAHQALAGLAPAALGSGSWCVRHGSLSPLARTPGKRVQSMAGQRYYRVVADCAVGVQPASASLW